jgi:putative transcriptional regulator
MIRHHPEDDFLLALAAGRLRGGAALVVSVHLESCAECRKRLHELHAVGGALLDSIEPELLAPESLARTLALIDAPLAEVARPSQPPRAVPKRASLPDDRAMPASLAQCDIGPWRWMGPGMRFSRVRLASDPQASLYLLRIAPGRSLATHTHTQLELTQVLCGSFDDGRSVFGPGDFDATDPDVHHQPVVAQGDTCVCLAYVEGRLEFDNRIAGAIGRMIGM